MPAHTAEAVLSVVGALVTMLLPYASGGPIFTYLFATGTLRVRATGCGVRITGADPAPMCALGIILAVPVAVLTAWGAKAALLGGAAALVTWFGCRLRVDVTSERTVVVRTFAFVVPWSWRSYGEAPHAFTDGWGDFADPLALHLDLGKGERDIELGWGGQGTPSCDDLAARINEGIAGLPPPGG